MMHLVAYDSSIANGSVLLQLAALTDQIAQIRDSAIIAPTSPFKLNKILQIQAFGVNLTRAQIQLPSTRRFGNYELSPLANAFAAGGAQTPVVDLRDDPYMVEEGEEIPVFVIQSNAGAQREYVVMILADEWHPVEPSNRITVRATGATTLVADTWTPVTLTFDVQLPRGEFKLIGMRGQSASGVAFRCINQKFSFRPGGFMTQSALALDPPGQRRGGLGEWFTFDYLTPPIVEVLATAGDTAETFFLDLVPL
jgi:hypothetical protein